MSEHVDTVVIGGSQAGLAVGHYLQRHGLPFVIVDQNERVGDAWRNRWDTLRLFTPVRYDGLPGMPFPGRSWAFPSKDARVPAFASELRHDIVQLHSSKYRNRSQLREGGALVVGAGNSGAEIAMDLAGHHRTWLAGARRRTFSTCRM